MRSRYTAYAVGDVGHVMRTTHPGSPHHEADTRAWAADLRRYCDAVRFEGLTVYETSEAGESGLVQFFARLSHGGRDTSFGEASRFTKVGDRWFYVDGVRIDTPTA